MHAQKSQVIGYFALLGYTIIKALSKHDDEIDTSLTKKCLGKFGTDSYAIFYFLKQLF